MCLNVYHAGCNIFSYDMSQLPPQGCFVSQGWIVSHCCLFTSGWDRATGFQLSGKSQCFSGAAVNKCLCVSFVQSDSTDWVLPSHKEFHQLYVRNWRSNIPSVGSVSYFAHINWRIITVCMTSLKNASQEINTDLHSRRQTWWRPKPDCGVNTVQPLARVHSSAKMCRDPRHTSS